MRRNMSDWCFHGENQMNTIEESSLSRKNIANLKHKGEGIIGKFGDLSIENNRIAYVKAMVFADVFSDDDIKSSRLEPSLGSLPSGTMREVIATFEKLHKARSEKTALLLKGFQDRYVAQGTRFQ